MSQDTLLSSQLPDPLCWRPRVLWAFQPEARYLHIVDIRGRQFRIKGTTAAHAYICEILREPVTLDRLLSLARERYASISEQTLSRFLALLSRYDLLEGFSPPPQNISATELQRYDRQIRYFSFFSPDSSDRYSMQMKLSQATVTLIGVGGVGNWIARHLAAMGVGHVILVDHDRVEPSNLNRQALYMSADLGRPKAAVAAQALTEFNPGIDVRSMECQITSPADVTQVIVGADLVVLAADKPMIDIRRWTSEACAQRRLPYIQGSLDTYLLQIGPLYHVPYTGCYNCREMEMQAVNPQLHKACTETMRRSPRQFPPLIGPLCGFVGSAVAMDVMRYLTGSEPPATLGRYFSIDARTWHTETIPVPRVPGCPVCQDIQTSA